MTKPIKVFWSSLSNRFYASQHYKEQNCGFVITGKKFDVTNDIAHAIIENNLDFEYSKNNKNDTKE